MTKTTLNRRDLLYLPLTVILLTMVMVVGCTEVLENQTVESLSIQAANSASTIRVAAVESAFSEPEIEAEETSDPSTINGMELVSNTFEIFHTSWIFLNDSSLNSG